MYLSLKNINWTPSRIIASSFGLAILLGTFLLLLPISRQDSELSFMKALFTATSSITVTGLATVDIGTYFTPFGHLVILALVQVGGLGCMIFSSLLMILIGKRLNFSSRKLIQEDLHHHNTGDIHQFIYRLLIMVAVIEVVGAIILSIGFSRYYSWGQSIYYGIFHSVMAFCNAGMSLFSDSLCGFKQDPLILLTIASLIILGGLGFSLVSAFFFFFRNRRLELNMTMRLALLSTVILLTIGTLYFLIIERNNAAINGSLGWVDRLVNAFFQSVTTRTAGFNSVDLTLLQPATILLFLFLMFIGANPGSTGGGIKTTTFGVLLLAVWSIVRHKKEIECYHRRIDWEIFHRAIALLVLGILFVIATTFLILFIEGGALQGVLFEVVSAFGTVGLSLGITASLSPLSQILLMIAMFVGRVGPLTMALVLGEASRHQNYRYPRENIIIG